MCWRKNTVFFALGGGMYVGLELFYRRRSHVSMFWAGGTCFLLLGKLRTRAFSLPIKSFLGMLQITAVEFLTGLAVNRDHRIWDYRKRRGNVMGQICPAFALAWLPLSALGMGLYGLMDALWERTAADPGKN